MEIGTIRQMSRQAKEKGLSISENALRHLVKTGELKCVRVGNRAYLSWQEIIKLYGIKEKKEEMK